MLNTKTILELFKKYNYKNPHLINSDKKYLGNNNKNIEMTNVKYITS